MNIALAWVVFVCVTMVFSIINDIKQTRLAFYADGTSIEHHISERVNSLEAISDGFTAMVSALEIPDYSKIRIYAKNIRKIYPDIFMFEVAESIDKSNLETFLKNARKEISIDYDIRRFSYEADRQWQQTKNKNSYTPITFIEPLSTESKNILGLDLDSHNFLRNAVQQAQANNYAVITEPFNLVEGPLAYLIVKATHQNPNRFTIMVIVADSLLPESQYSSSGMQMTLHHKHFSIYEEKGNLYSNVGESKSGIESGLFPKFEDRRQLKSNTHPFILHRYKQMGWTDLNWVLLFIIGLVGIASFLVAISFAKRYHANRQSMEATTEKLFYLANHDSLTGLANRYLLDDRLRHALEQAKRNKHSIAVLFLDLNGFKAINDEYGHQTGDEILKRVAERLRACIRGGDTISRRSGDEFIIILENISEDNMALSAIMDKIQSGFSRNFKIDSNDISIGASIGKAVYPDDAETAHDLLAIADKGMYQKKSELR